jgi:hypothetical protein
MQAKAPKYRLRTVSPISKDEVLARFVSEVVEPMSLESKVWPLRGESTLVFLSSDNPGAFFVELQCQFVSLPNGIVSYGLLGEFLKLCHTNGGYVKIVRNGSIVPANGGVMSDVWRSKANAVASHLAAHPADVQSQERLFAKAPNHSIERTSPGKPAAASHVKR